MEAFGLDRKTEPFVSLVRLPPTHLTQHAEDGKLGAHSLAGACRGRHQHVLRCVVQRVEHLQWNVQ